VKLQGLCLVQNLLLLLRLLGCGEYVDSHGRWLARLGGQVCPWEVWLWVSCNDRLLDCHFGSIQPGAPILQCSPHDLSILVQCAARPMHRSRAVYHVTDVILQWIKFLLNDQAVQQCKKMSPVGHRKLWALDITTTYILHRDKITIYCDR